MTLIKSKIKSLAWLKSAIYISVFAGVILSSKPASAFVLGFQTDDEILGTFSMTAPAFQDTGLLPSFVTLGNYWQAIVNVTQNRSTFNDDLLITGLFQHIRIPSHPEDSSAGRAFSFSFPVNADDATSSSRIYEISDRLGHPPNHSDVFNAKLDVTFSNEALVFDRIKSWTLTLDGEHTPVPEPTTIFGSALALGVGGWLKRKKSSQQNKTTSQH